MVLALPGCVTLDKSPNFSEPLFPHYKVEIIKVVVVIILIIDYCMGLGVRIERNTLGMAPGTG